jgi:hypothetical protein
MAMRIMWRLLPQNLAGAPGLLVAGGKLLDFVAPHD